MAKVLQDILDLILRVENDDVMPATDLFNEGWMLRLLLSLEEKGIHTFPFEFAKDATWMSEGLLSTAFEARRRSDKLAEKHTHADGIVGHIQTQPGTKRGVSLAENATQFVVLEAKMYSKLSPGTTHAPDYDQATRNVACMAEAARRYADHHEGSWPPLEEVGFYVLAPEEQIKKGTFAGFLDKATIRRKVEERIAGYPAKDQEGRFKGFVADHLAPLLDRLKIGTLSWEDLLAQTTKSEAAAGARARSFYELCVEFNKPTRP